MFRPTHFRFQAKRIYANSPFQKTIKPIQINKPSSSGVSCEENGDKNNENVKKNAPNSTYSNDDSLKISKQTSESIETSTFNSISFKNRMNQILNKKKVGAFNKNLNDSNDGTFLQKFESNGQRLGRSLAKIFGLNSLVEKYGGESRNKTLPPMTNGINSIHGSLSTNVEEKILKQKLPFYRLEKIVNNLKNENIKNFMQKSIQFARTRLDIWARLLLPELSKHEASKKKTFVMKGIQREQSDKSVFYIPVDVKLFLLLCVLGVYCYKAIMNVVEDTKQGKMLQDTFKRLVKSKIAMEYKSQLSSFDEDGEENDVIKGLCLLNRDEIVELFRAMNWYSIGHRTFGGRFEIGDSNPMVAAILLNSRLYIWMIRLLGDPKAFTPNGIEDYEFVTECTEALLRFSHDETVAKMIVEKQGLSVLRLVRQQLFDIKNNILNERNKFINEDSTNKYNIDRTINIVEDLICKLLAFKWVHGSIEEEEIRKLMQDMSNNSKSAYKLTKSLTGSWWTWLKLEQSQHLFQRFDTLRGYYTNLLRSQGYNNLADNIENNTLMAETVNELWTFTMMHRQTIPYQTISSIGIGLTILLTTLGSRRYIQRKLSTQSFADGYRLPFVNGFSIFLTSLCAVHYFVLYPRILTEIRNRVEKYENDVNILFKGTLLPICLHNYKIFANYIGTFFILTSIILLSVPSMAIILGSTLSGMLALLTQILLTSEINYSDFFQSLQIILNHQYSEFIKSPIRVLLFKFIVDEDVRHHALFTEAVELRKKATAILNKKKYEEMRG